MLTLRLEMQLTIEEPYQELESRLEEVVVKEAGRFRRAVTETRTSTRMVARTLRVTKTTSATFEFCAVPAGTFVMGSEREQPVHSVTLRHDFHMGRCPVTQEQWEAVMGGNPSGFKGADRPVEQVTRDDCQEFVRRLNATGRGVFRLPTEAEWEYACRAGSTGKFCFGDDESQLGDYAWYSANSDGRSQPVGRKKPNAWGLHDMHGNVWEWCQDWYDDYGAAPVTDPQGASSGFMGAGVFRGGCWRGGADFAASAHRGGRGPGYKAPILGFRLVCVESR